MSKRTIPFVPFMLTAAAFLLHTASVSGQEVNSDVNIPTPREMAVGTRTLNGIFVGPDVVASESQVFGRPSTQAPSGILVEGAIREELGDFMTSLLVRAGLIAFDVAPVSVADSEEKASIPLLAERTEHAASLRQR